MGLLLGASLLSLLEIFEFLVNCVIYLIRKCWNRIACTTNVSKVKDAGIAFENYTHVFEIRIQFVLTIVFYFNWSLTPHCIRRRKRHCFITIIIINSKFISSNLYLYSLPGPEQHIHTLFQYYIFNILKIQLETRCQYTFRKKTRNINKWYHLSCFITC